MADWTEGLFSSLLLVVSGVSSCSGLEDLTRARSRCLVDISCLMDNMTGWDLGK